MVIILDSSRPPLVTGEGVRNCALSGSARMRRNSVVRLGDILRLRSKSKKNAKLIAAIHRTGLFDAAYYIENNPDVAAVPSRRWLELGWRSLRVVQPK